MAYRAALCAGATVSAIVAVGGDIPPDVKTVPAPMWPRVIVAAGSEDHWYTAEKLSADERFLVAHGVPHTIIRYSGKHEFTSELRATLSRELGLSNS